MARGRARAVATVSLWLLTRGAVLLLYAGPQHWVSGDIAYFAESLRTLPQHGLTGTLREYPLPGLAVLAVPWSLALLLGGGVTANAWLVVVLALVADAAFTVALYRAAGPGGNAAVAVWLFGAPLLGATAYARFDILPGVLAGGAVLMLGRRPRAAALAAAVAAAIKLWPALLVPALAAPRGTRTRVLSVVSAVVVVVVAGTLAVSGWARLFSPLVFQGGRGLQIESVAASPAMVAWLLWPGRFTVGYAPAHAFEVTGPGTPALVHVSTALTVLVAVAVVALWWRLWRAGGPADAVGWVSLAAVSGFVVSNRVLSPQYLLWLVPVAAAAVAGAGRRGRAQRRWAAVLLVTTGLTQLEFPVCYGDLVGHHAGSPWAVSVLVARNALLVWLCADAGLRAWRATAAQRGSALARQAPGPEGNVVRSLR